MPLSIARTLTTHEPTQPAAHHESPLDPNVFQIPLNVTVYRFGVEERIPTVHVPLAKSDPAIILNMQDIYDEHFFAMRWGRAVDYSHAPHNLDHYSTADRFMIDARTLTLKDA